MWWLMYLWMYLGTGSNMIFLQHNLRLRARVTGRVFLNLKQEMYMEFETFMLQRSWQVDEAR